MKTIATMGAAVALGCIAIAGQAQAQTQVGVLNCEVSGGTGLIVTSRKDLVCTFQNSAGELEIYDGYIRKFGLDIGTTSGGAIVWNVIAAGGANVRGALEGSYAGATAEASLFAGLGANVLVGDSSRSVALQPVSISGQSGLNLAIGATDLTLRLRPPDPGFPLPRRR